MPSARLSAAVEEFEPLLLDEAPAAATPSEEQLAIYDWFEHEGGNLVVEALAGTGKSSSILRAIDFAPEDNILLTAFNKRIQEELEQRLTNPRAKAQTLHSVGFEAIRRTGWGYVTPKLRGFDREDWLAEQVTYGAPWGAKRLVGKLCTKARELQPIGATVESLCDLAVQFDLLPGADNTQLHIEHVASMTLRAMQIAARDEVGARLTGIDGADMIFLPLVNDWLTPQYDMGVVDEYQDLTLAQLTVARRVCHSYARIALVGDTNQNIYQFKGTDAGSYAQMKQELRAVLLPLTTTYRCPRKIVHLAQQYVPHYRAADSAPEGVVDSVESLEQLVEQAEVGDFILSRKNAPLARVALALLRAHKRAKIQGRETGAGLKSLVKRLMKGDAAHSVRAFLAKLEHWRERELSRAYAMKRSDLVDLTNDKADTLQALAADASSVQGLHDIIDTLFTDRGQGNIVCSTVHKAKGLEADRVFILRHTFNVPVSCQCGHQHYGGAGCRMCWCKEHVPDPARLQEERNVKYVAITRAKSRLTWCEERF